MRDLPEFKKRSLEQVKRLMTQMLTNLNLSIETHLREIITYDDGHYRAVFSAAYFGADTPTKSQWNTLKKKLKRHDRLLFVFKDHGEVEFEGETCYYIDFGFFAH